MLCIFFFFILFRKDTRLNRKLNEFQSSIKTAQHRLEKWKKELHKSSRAHDHESFGCGDADLLQSSHTHDSEMHLEEKSPSRTPSSSISRDQSHMHAHAHTHNQPQAQTPINLLLSPSLLFSSRSLGDDNLTLPPPNRLEKSASLDIDDTKRASIDEMPPPELGLSRQQSIYNVKKHQDLLAIISAEASTTNFQATAPTGRQQDKKFIFFNTYLFHFILFCFVFSICVILNNFIFFFCKRTTHKNRARHVVLNDENFGVMEDDPDLPLEMEWLLDEILDSKTSLVVCGRLKRAISTAIIGLWERFSAEHSHEPIYVLPYLHTQGTHADVQIPVLAGDVSSVEKSDLAVLNEFYSKRLEAIDINNNVRKTTPMSDSINTDNDRDRVQAFVDWAFHQHQKRTVIAFGQSDWFQHFFKTFLPAGTTHISAKRKLGDCSAVAFRMSCEVFTNSSQQYTIQQGTITQIFGTFI
ncbi:hypothetical protein RFI_27123 [Reticulomyxa filosa]|uniref:Uncharacterized protein n=1 Tax=Reticulomyxa filosa TaxID=46433 RepID=X6M8D9_RETFI|nr:hypothetical protein RFI_27123 [Reticulomyxa filosa]|eukprot:ETO10258.1 hypothetical protein RFI_27123 [Reticulomyxa filosa]